MMKNAAWEAQHMEKQWTPPQVPENIPQGDMPGDQIRVECEHIQKANTIFPELLKLLSDVMKENPHQRAVVAVCGGSGVGKSETASLISYYLHTLGIGSYTMSGDNYPYRIPEYNDAERKRIFRYGGLKGLITSGQATPDRQKVLRELQQQQRDADPALLKEYPWLDAYQREGRKALKGYLGTKNEIDFDEVTRIVAQFKNGADTIALKRMGRVLSDVWYDMVDLAMVRVLVIEWTHSNSDNFQGVDIPVLLNSTPQETLAHRKSRNRDGDVDSSFTTMVLGLEQKLLEAQADKAKIILSKSGALLSYKSFRELMADTIE